MKRKHVISSHIESIGYDEENRIVEVEYRDGAIWQYGGVDKRSFEKLTGASSIGTYLFDHIVSQVPNKYSAKEIQPGKKKKG